MGEPANRASVVRFSTAEWPEQRRIEAFREIYGRVISRVELDRPQGLPQVTAAFRAFSGLGLGRIAAAEMRGHRRAPDIVCDDVVLMVNLGGRVMLTQRSRDIEVGTGEAIVTTEAEQRTVTVRSADVLALRMPRSSINDRISDLDERIAKPIRDSEPVRLLAAYAGMLHDSDTGEQAQLHRLAVQHVYDLVALALGEAQDFGEVAAGGMRAALLHAIKSDIESALDHADLTAANVAARHRLPLRYLQRLFETEGTTCTDFILGRRLARAHRMLLDPRHDDVPVSTIAFDAGFRHLSRFNRAFRAHFGTTPSDLRAQAQHDD